MGEKITFKTKPIERKKKPYNAGKTEILRNENTLFTSDANLKKRRSILSWD